MHKIINIPVGLIKRCKNEGKTSLEMLACAFRIKALYQNSTMYNVTVTNVMKTFGVSYKKALKLMDTFDTSCLFVYNKEKRCLHAKTFKDKTIKTFGHKTYKKYQAQSDFCWKMQVTDEPLRMITRALREVLTINAIAACERDDSIVRHKKHSVTKPVTSKAMTQRKIASIIGLSRSSACRYTKRMIDDNRIDKSKVIAECVIPIYNDDTQAEYSKTHPNSHIHVWHNTRTGQWSGWIIYGCVYSLLQRRDTNSLRHVIHNYHHTIQQPQPMTSSEIDGKWRY